MAYCNLRHPQGYAFNYRHEILGLPKDDDGLFEVTSHEKALILARDRYACIYCGRAAPIVVSPIQYMDRALSEAFGPTWSLDGLEHASSTCPTCFQYLPGILRVIPSHLLLSLDQAKREDIYKFLQALQLHVHHPIPKVMLKKLFSGDQERKKYKEEFELATQRLHVTACNQCNVGIGDRLAPIEEIEQLLRTVIYSNGGPLYERDRSTLQGLHFRARMLERSAAG